MHNAIAPRSHLASRPRSAIGAILGGLLAVALALVPGCTPARAPSASGPGHPAAAWTGAEAELFDDSIDLGTFNAGNVGTPGVPPARDEAGEDRIPARLNLADGVTGAKVIGITREPVGDKTRYRLELTSEGEPFSGARIESPFTLIVEPVSPAFGTIRAQESQIIGHKLVVFYRRYVADDTAEPVTHFHLSPMTQPVVDAVRRAATRRQVSGG